MCEITETSSCNYIQGLPLQYVIDCIMVAYPNKTHLANVLLEVIILIEVSGYIICALME